MAMTDGPPNLVQARLLFTLRDGQPSIVLKNLFGEEQMSALADYVQATLYDAQLPQAKRGLSIVH